MDVNNQDLDALKRTSYKPVEMNHRNHLIRNQEFFAYIPPEIIIGILSKLPVRTIISCKCVCKSWLTLLESNEFVKSHLLKAIPGLAFYRFRMKLYKFFDFEDGLDLEHHGLRYKFVTEFNILGCNGWIAGSADGLLFLCNTKDMLKHHALHVCNPITRDYIELDCNEFVDDSCRGVVTYGFGSSKITGHHKVVRIFLEFMPAPGGPPLHYVPKSECVCHVYTIGTGLWRRISPVPQLLFRRDGDGAFLNGNLHWSVSDFEGPQLLISCFDLETERFSTSSTPLLNSAHTTPPTIFEDCLCLCETRYGKGIDIWLMKEYGVEKSWTKQLFIGMTIYSYGKVAYPIKIFKDGDILLAWDYKFLFYSKKNNTLQKVEAFEPHRDINAFLYTPSFLSLKSFGMEKVMSF
ncbi:hypothetical protein ACS0TY_028353 [Phlomoides rotata]